ncbi:hypothetical protein TTHERM_00584640 (macronuclear) [Tetrahymena thermophila SB210]|uniref:Uncharacterized protein n=1 Tax=Tetrahymena thermophila (strain SB210) TaxID=312017 RepID=I7MCT7_TETTS|nr:hypothetical protein TTHERM_00584640 [Tetrahymena thermophila SB210]EAR84908.1 hypothetical protein TTHERM_00584640 [Tetrahymena thermophila SB210]|eukprot:XP_001032571.1 hypothetical protein TTHERM_00584640 [Tetrahymena thermophila SB210]
MHQNNPGNRYFSQNQFNQQNSFNQQAALNLLQQTGGLGGSGFNLLQNAQNQTAGFPISSLSSQTYPSQFGINQQANSASQINNLQGNQIIPGASNFQISRNLRVLPPAPGSVQSAQNSFNLIKNQPQNIQKRRNEIEIQTSLENQPLIQKKIKTDNLSLTLQEVMQIEPENKQPINQKVYDISKYEISKEVDEKIQNTKKLLENIPKIKPNFISLQCCESAKLQVDLFPQKFFNPEFKNELKKDIFEDPSCFKEAPQSKSLKKVYCLVEDLSKLMNVLKIDKENEIKMSEKSSYQRLNSKESRKKDDGDNNNKKIIKKQGPGRRKKRIEDSEQESEQQNMEEENNDDYYHQSKEDSENYSLSQPQSATQKKKNQQKRILRKKRNNSKKVQDNDDSDFIKSDDSESQSEEDQEDQSSEQSENSDQENSLPQKTKRRILRRKKSVVNDDSEQEDQEEGSFNKNGQDDSGEKQKNKRGRRLLQKNKLTKVGKNKNTVESDEEQEFNNPIKKEKNNEDSSENDGIKIARKQPKAKLQIDDDEEKEEQNSQSNQKQTPQLNAKIASIQKQEVKVENETKIEVEEEQSQPLDQQIKLENDIKIEEKVESSANSQINSQQQQTLINIENKLQKIKEKDILLASKANEIEKKQKYLFDQQQKILQLKMQYNTAILEQKHAAINLEIVNKHTSIS